MKNLLIYTFCFFALLACKKSERLQDEYTIVSGIVSEVQRGIPIEGATVVFQEFLEDEKTDDCFGSCSRLLDSVLTDVNGYYQFKFKAKKGANWGYNITCRKLNYIVKHEAYSPHLIKENPNTANLGLVATGDFELIFYNHDTTVWKLLYGNGIDRNSSSQMVKFNLENVEAYTKFKISATYCKKNNCDANTIWKEEYFEVEANTITKDTLHFYGY